MERYDVAVVGAGPAGSAAALAARRAGATVVLLDRDGFPRDKACGDGIAPHALDVLAELGVPDPAAGYRPVPRLRLISPAGVQVARDLPRAAYTIPRRVFDERLVSAAVEAGAELRIRAVREVVADGGGIAVGGVRAGAVIGADGAGSVVRRALGEPPNPHGHLALAIRGYAPWPAHAAEQYIVTASAQWPAYAWAFPIGDGRANVGYGEVLRGRPVTRHHLLRRLTALLPDLDPDSVRDIRGHHLPLSTYRPAVGRGAVLLAGDAMSLINPFTGEGIFYAVLSGQLAGAAAAGAVAAGVPHAAADRYAAAFTGRLARHLRHSGLAARLGQRRWIVDGAVRAARRDQRVFDTMVELGLGDGRLDAVTLLRVTGGVLAR